ncbi:MAG TPA: ComEC/Rec2 family competence protein, partial [Acidobacteriaceae bacterium]|nr:ComEC/Rec2 family competence protein [Acidobacteriaceae bacterium]
MAASLAIPESAVRTGGAHPRTPHARFAILAAPMLFIAVFFAGGTTLSCQFWLLPSHLLAALLLLFPVTAVSALVAPRIAPIAAAFLGVLLGLFCAEVQPHLPASTPLEDIAFSTPASTPAVRHARIATTHVVFGDVIRTTAIRRIDTYAPYSDVLRHERSQQIDLRVATVDGSPLPAPEGLRLTLYAPADASFPQIACGALFMGSAALHTEERFLDPDVWDASRWLRQQGIAALGSAHADQATITPARHRPELICRIRSFQQAASERLVSLADAPGMNRFPAYLRVSHDDAVMLTAMLTGDRTLLSHRLRVGFERTGSFHLLVVSGMHLAIFSGLVFFGARRVRLPRLPASLVTIGLS